ncbi:MAG TPA: hypothetical protein DCG19_05480 [Cryomorphaceae bacterium]|nr:hypothetical protein [Owenweeksia sp.]MBF99487.1 hypothetical protein [Owenweeksia sp.]HAD96837.1 hypothetical protein [Cryomorphaceae bacterium]HBF19275.1 hypothetical protein [Cryomorphaceae bacterium]HCQ15496.1 hypothetical protein [Cryomorphaceae bacterium]|tara:strand:+ start:389 stop:646 length:258 start_codon:yes stop_codon:yes gene_type:complete
MKKINLFALALLFVGAIACNNPESADDNIEDGMEEVEEGMEEAGEDIEEGAEDMGESIEESTEDMDDNLNADATEGEAASEEAAH